MNVLLTLVNKLYLGLLTFLLTYLLTMPNGTHQHSKIHREGVLSVNQEKGVLLIPHLNPILSVDKRSSENAILAFYKRV